MDLVNEIPADKFLDEVISALSAADAAALRHLESSAHSVSAPLNRSEYVHSRTTLAALLDLSARNLRLLRRVLNRQSFLHRATKT